MSTLDVRLAPVGAELIDPSYERRHDLVEVAPSLRVVSIGCLALPQEFSKIYAPTEISDYKTGRLMWTARPEFDASGQTVQYQVPPKFEQFREAIGMIAAHEHAAYPDARYSFVSFEADQRTIRGGTAHRAPTWHRDGAPGMWFHMYVVTDRSPTEFMVFNEPTDQRVLNYDVDGSSIVSGQSYEILQANVTTFHRSPAVAETATRTFLRATYTHDLGQVAVAA